MTFKTYEINVDLVNDISTTSAIRFSQNDRNSAKLLLTITNKGAELDLSKAKSVRMSFKKPDGTRVFQNDCQPINALKGKYQILLKTQTLTSIGNVIAQIHIEEEDRILDTQKFFFVVNESLAGDGAVESTNEFTIIQKALELGEKFKNVDFDPIIKAGELAAGGLPKTGGTMTGDIKMANGKSIRLQNAEDKTIMTLGSNSGGGFYSWSDVAAKGVFRYDPATHILDIQAGTNVYKKTDIYGAFTQYDGRAFNITGQDLNTIVQAGQYSGQNLLNTPEGAVASSTFYYIEVVKHLSVNYAKQIATTLATTTPTSWIRTMNNGVWGNWIKQIDANGGTFDGHVTMGIEKNLVFNAKESTFKLRGQLANNKLVLQSISPTGVDKFVLDYDSVSDTFNLNAANTNLVKNTGGTMTGNLMLDVSSANKYFGWRRGDGKNHYIYGGDDVVGLYSEVAKIAKTPWKYTPSTETFEVLAPNTNLVTKTKDGRATPTLTADAELISANQVVADRRGNTVTLRAPIRRKLGSTQLSVLFTMPADMRPTGFSVQQGVNATDGTPAIFTIAPDGNVTIQNASATEVSGKNFYITCTYVVD